MFKSNNTRISLFPLAILICALCASMSLAQTSALTYQGQLNVSGSPANGTYDLQFKLFDALAGGTQISITNTATNIVVTNGLFNTTLDFGSSAFPGAARWLEISVRPAGGGTYTTLSPRQLMASTPYSLRSLAATSADGLSVACVNCVTSNQIGSLPTGSANYIQNTTTLQASSNFNISGNGLIGGRVGIGTTTPGFPLSFSNTVGDKISLWGTSGAHYGFGLQGALMQIHTPTAVDDIAFGFGSSTLFTETLRFKGNGNVGIGTTTPTAKLEVAGTGLFTGTLSASTSSSTGVSGTSTASNGTGVSGVASNGANAYGVYGNNIGIGAGVKGESTNGIGVWGYSGTSVGVFALSQGQGRGSASLYAANFNTTDGMAANLLNSSNFATAIFANGGAGEVLYLKNGGGQFIRAVNSAETATLFSVNGDGTTVTKVLQITGGSDLSEQFDVNSTQDSASDSSSAEIQPGLVVSIDPENPGKLVVSDEAYDRKVAGIISGAGGVKTGMLMGQTDSVANGKQPVALTGRVYCWVDATNGAIAPGDLLTSSPIPGHAMKVTDHTKAQGAIIGKAMTSLKEGRGLVLVLVTLQ